MDKKRSTEIYDRTMKEFRRITASYNINYEDKSTWNEQLVNLWNRLRANHYYQYKKECKLRANDFWVNKMDSGILQDILKKYGLAIYNKGNIRCIDAGRMIMKLAMEQIIIPEMEKTIGIKGIKLVKNAGPSAQNCLDFSKVVDDTLIDN